MIRKFSLNSSLSLATFGLAYVLALISTFASGYALAATGGNTGVDAVLIMDSSGSMAKNDPKKLRVPAAKLFMSLLGGTDRIGLISFSDNGYPVLHLTAPGADTDERILASADRVSSKGVYTNLHAALQKGIDMLDREGRQGQEKMLVLMSDGKMDVGDSDEDWTLTRKLREDLLQSARQKGIKVFTIAFTDASDVELLKEVAQTTDALFKLAQSDRDLHEVFSAIFETAKNPDMLPIDGNEFVIDDSIEEVTIVASKEREDVRIYLQSPDGKKLSSDDAGANLKWFLSDNFDMITMPKPVSGTWKLVSTDGRNRAYIVTDLSLNHNDLQSNLSVNEDMRLEAWLEQEGKPLDKEAVLTNTTFEMEITDPAGVTARFELLDQGEFGDRKAADGIYANTLSYVNPGAYKLGVIATSATFQRQKTLHFEVDAPAGGIPVAEPVTAAAETPEPEPQSEPEPETEPEVEETEPAEVEDEPPAEPEATAEPEEEGINLVVALGVFFAVNLLLAGIGFGVWWFLKKRKKASEETPDEEEAE